MSKWASRLSLTKWRSKRCRSGGRCWWWAVCGAGARAGRSSRDRCSRVFPDSHAAPGAPCDTLDSRQCPCLSLDAGLVLGIERYGRFQLRSTTTTTGSCGRPASRRTGWYSRLGLPVWDRLWLILQPDAAQRTRCGMLSLAGERGRLFGHADWHESDAIPRLLFFPVRVFRPSWS